VQAGEAGPQPVRLVGAGSQIEVAEVDVLHLRLGGGVGLDQLLGRGVRAEAQRVARGHAVGQLAQRVPVDGVEVEDAALLGEGLAKAERGVELDPGCAAGDLDPERLEPLGVSPADYSVQ
jgi:hypothetical protein